jgi:hypothetical protein
MSIAAKMFSTIVVTPQRRMDNNIKFSLREDVFQKYWTDIGE